MIRPAGPVDVPALADLARETYIAAFGHSFEPADLQRHLARTLADPLVARFVAETTVLVAERAGRLVGFVQCGPAEDGGQLLHRLYVHPTFQNRGIGSQLLTTALALPEMAAAPTITLDVWEQNPAARRFYERFGFIVVGTRRFEVASGAETTPDLVMVRRSVEGPSPPAPP